MDISKLTGIPWHVENLKNNNSERRHKTWCAYFDNGNCTTHLGKCTGSVRCSFYKFEEKKKMHHNTAHDVDKDKIIKEKISELNKILQRPYKCKHADKNNGCKLQIKNQCEITGCAYYISSNKR